jgi:gliding motility-associated-like protein
VRYKQSGIYRDTLYDKMGCPTFNVLHLDLGADVYFYDTVVTCQPYVWARTGKSYSPPGNYFDTIRTVGSCDTIYQLTLDSGTNTLTQINQTVCKQFLWSHNNRLYTNSGTYRDTTLNSLGCDSILVLNLTILPPIEHFDTLNACDSFFWARKSRFLKVSGNYADTVVVAGSCDTIFNLSLSVHPSYSDTVDFSSCKEFIWSRNSKTYTQSGFYADTLKTSKGCDSIRTLNLQIFPPIAFFDTATSCDSLRWRNKSLKFTGNYKDTVIGNLGNCDTIYHLNLSINYTSFITESHIACKEFVWPFNNRTYTNSGLFFDTLSSSKNCDSIHRLALTILPVPIISQNVNTCNTYFWSQTNQWYTQSGVYADTISKPGVCDSIFILYLNIGNSVYQESEIAACNRYTWTRNNKTYVESGLYFDTTFTSSGCDSVFGLRLTILKYKDSFEIITIPDSGCAPLTVHFEIRSLVSQNYLWTLRFSNGTNFIGNQTSSGILDSVVFSDSGLYSGICVVNLSNGCTDTFSTQEIKVFPKPFADFTYSPDVIRVNRGITEFKNKSQRADKYLWEIEPFGSFSVKDPIVKYVEPDTGKFQVMLIAENTHGCKDTAEAELYVYPIFNYFIPNSFSPNRDGNNDMFEPIVNGGILKSITIFNRWGDLIYKNTEGLGWDGKHGGQDVAPDMYLYVMDFESNSSEETRNISGYINLIR